jgi:hypothetical protein
VHGGIHGLHAGAAQPVHRLAGDRDGEARQQCCHARHIAIVLARLVGAAEDHILDRRRIDPRALEYGGHGRRSQVVRPHACERAAVPADRRAHRVDDPRFSHRCVPGPEGRRDLS